MTRSLLGAAAFLLAFSSGASAQQCTQDEAWRRVRLAYPIHVQTIAMCRDASTGKSIIVVTEPPPHIVRMHAEPIMRALFSTPLISVEQRRKVSGFDGWTQDLIIVADAHSAENQQRLREDLGLLASLVFGSSYKAEIESISDLPAASAWAAPRSFDVSKDELFEWLLGPKAEKLISLDGGAAATLREIAQHQIFGTFHSVTPGLVVTLVRRSELGQLNDHVSELRRFFVDVDVLLGAIKFDGPVVALIGRERTTPRTVMPPLRVETVLLLASQRESHLAQSYQRNLAFAGKLLANASADLFGWDWAPILLSDAIVDTEFGSLLNFTDNMLKGWSESGHIAYQGFDHKYPDRYPFGTEGAMTTLNATRLVFNWNTAGAGYISSVGKNMEVFAIRNTGSLPVSYFPEGSQSDEGAKQKLTAAEDEAYRYFSSLRNPLLQRAVQYSALYQICLAFGIRASPPHGLADKSASMSAIEVILASHLRRALTELTNSNSPTNTDLLLQSLYLDVGPAAREKVSEYLNDKNKQKLDSIRKKYVEEMASLHAKDRSWQGSFFRSQVEGYPPPSHWAKTFNELAKVGIRMAYAPETVRREIVDAMVREPEGWIKTPSIVVSRGDPENSQAKVRTGGHNIGGRATRIAVDPSVEKGKVRVTGNYNDGRVIRINPEDEGAGRELVRAFDREVGLDDGNLHKGVRALEVKLRDVPSMLKPVRPMANGLDMTGVRSVRGAEPNPKAIQVGFRPPPERVDPKLVALSVETRADVIVMPGTEGFVVYRVRPAPPTTMVAPNPTSMHQALTTSVQRVAKGPPVVTTPKIIFRGVHEADVSRHVQSLVNKSEAIAGAGGKPPFGRDNKLYTLADGPEPQRFTDSLLGRNPSPPPERPSGTFDKVTDALLGVVGKRRERLFAASPEAKALLEVKPKWSEAIVKFQTTEDTLLVGLPKHQGSMHMVEVSVPVIVPAGPPKSVFLRVISWLKEKPSAIKSQEMNARISEVFKTSKAIDVEEALIQYKTLMMQEFGADRVHMNLLREGSDIVITKALTHDVGAGSG